MDPKTYQGFLRDEISSLQGQVAALQILTARDAAWTPVTSFSGTWATSTAVAYIKLGQFVALRGSIASGTINTTAFTLPSGYWPTGNPWFATTSSNNAFAILEISTAGAVIPFIGSTANFTLNCVFPVA